MVDATLDAVSDAVFNAVFAMRRRSMKRRGRRSMRWCEALRRKTGISWRPASGSRPRPGNSATASCNNGRSCWRRRLLLKYAPSLIVHSLWSGGHALLIGTADSIAITDHVMVQNVSNPTLVN